jgi:flagellar biosynthesis protein FlhB
MSISWLADLPQSTHLMVLILCVAAALLLLFVAMWALKHVFSSLALLCEGLARVIIHNDGIERTEEECTKAIQNLSLSLAILLVLLVLF